MNSKNGRLKHLDPWSEKHLDLVTPLFATSELDRLEARGMSRQNTNELIKEIKGIFAYAVFSGALKSNPFGTMKLRKVQKKRLPALTHEEVQVLLTEAKRRNHPFYNVWLLTIALGLRRSELAGLKWLDIDFQQQLVHLQRQHIPREGAVSRLKDWEERMVAIPKFLIPVLKELRLKAQTDFVIELDRHEWISGDQARVLRLFCREIGIKELSHHLLRATHITLALADNVPLAIVKENVGHAQLSTTDKYFSASGLQMRGQMDKLRILVPRDEEATVIPLNAE